MSMKRTMMYLPEDMHRFLASEAERRGLSMAEVAREAITEYRVKRGAEDARRVSAIFGSLDDEDPARDVALSVDDVLAQHYAEASTWEQENGLADTD